MLDQETKKRIDTARNILVGKVPDPKAQVEQITIALIYKFMDDMDREAQELGGKSRFFSGNYAKYSWVKLMDAKIGGTERLNLYGEAVTQMSQNANLPQLFRDIFNGAFLPYRDPETLNLFLKEINGFVYDHSERLGDAFEYLLSVLGSQGDAGQFRTPRHIIDFIVKVVDPQKNESVLDPACGTAGFLIAAYKHVLNQNKDKKAGDKLTPDEKTKLMSKYVGYDISPDMDRLSRVNMYLHGFPMPKIYEYDTLTSEDRWNETYDVILANPPFMTPTGGIRPHKRFSVQANRSEVLFVDYMAEHLNIHGRAGIIVPEGIIFQSGNAYKDLRKMLVEDGYLYAVVSLPAGVFNPYSGVKTSILILDKVLAKKSKDILFIKIENDGFDLGLQRLAIDKNDLPIALETLNKVKSGQKLESTIAVFVSKERIAKAGDYNLSVERYRVETDYTNAKWPMVKLGDSKYFSIESGGTPDSKNKEYWNGKINWATLVDLPAKNLITEIYSTERKITEQGLRNSSAKTLPIGSILVSSRATIGRVAVARVPVSTNQGFKNIVIQDASKVLPEFIALIMTGLKDTMESMTGGSTFKEISKSNFERIQIPLPPINIQKKIVAEIKQEQNGIKDCNVQIEKHEKRTKDLIAKVWGTKD